LDLLIIGGGIVGSGIARDAALRRLKVGLVEQHDFAFGTSSRSSRLLHGGLRYLAQGRVGLVREASVEKKVIHHIAPHLAEPLPFIFPTYRGNPHWRLWQLKIGVKLYDLLCGGRNLGRSTWLNANDVRVKVPTLRADGLTGAVRYYDGFTNDARLTLDTLRSAAGAGAMLVNYCRFRNATRTELWTCEVEDVLTGKAFTLHAGHIVNATGPWADGLPHSKLKLRVTKGIHIVVDRSRVAVPETVVMTEGQRILFAIPWGERTILGTTDTDYAGSVDEVRAEAADIRCLLQITNQFFPKIKLTSADVISFWAGLRPLLADPDGKPSDISRSHQIKNPEPGWWDVAGGKLTTYRLMAEQVVDQIVSSLKKSRAAPPLVAPCRTAEERLLPASQTQNISGIIPPELCRPVVEHYCANEWAVHLDDVMVRRTSWHQYQRDAALNSQRVAQWMGEFLGWTREQRIAEIQRYSAITGCPPADKSSASAASPAAI
jgi:glycerol-3-phosphate dehydrogenase